MTKVDERLNYELEEMKQIIHQTEQFLRQLEQEIMPTYQAALTSAIALNLHSFYTGAERIFEVIAKQVDHYQPTGSNWHRQLLDQMLVAIPNLRPAVISENTYLLLDELRRFRHVVRTVYAYQLDSERILELANKSFHYFSTFKKEIQQYIHETRINKE